MREPLNQFADRLIRNGEVKEFIKGLLEKHVRPEIISEAVLEFDEEEEAAASERWLRRPSR